MKKIISTSIFICLFTVANFAGWIHTTNKINCEPETSEPGTCVWVNDYNQRPATTPGNSESAIKSIVNFISDHNPFDYFLN